MGQVSDQIDSMYNVMKYRDQVWILCCTGDTVSTKKLRFSIFFSFSLVRGYNCQVTQSHAKLLWASLLSVITEKGVWLTYLDLVLFNMFVALLP